MVGGMCGGGYMWQWGMVGRHVWQGVCMAGDMCGREGMHGGRGMHGRGCAWHALPPPPQILRDTVNERAVRILLECILVYKVNGVNTADPVKMN